MCTDYGVQYISQEEAFTVSENVLAARSPQETPSGL